MKTFNSKHILALMGATLLSSAAFAQQTLDESLTVEGRYKPTIIAADRLSLFPSAMQLTAPQSTMDYEQKGVWANFAPDALPMPATGWRTLKKYSDTKGYVDLRLGSWLNSSLSAGYQAIRTEDTRLNVRLQHNSTSLWRPSEKGFPFMYSQGKPAKRFRYDETVGADLRHRVGNTGILTADLQYHLGYFNYYGSVVPVPNFLCPIVAPTQTLNDIYAKAAWTSAPSRDWSYEVGADFRHFAYRSHYETSVHHIDPTSSVINPASYVNAIYRYKGTRENELNVRGALSYRLSNVSSIDAGLKYSGFFYGEDMAVNRIQLTPGYEWKSTTTSLRIGFNAAYVGISNGRSSGDDIYYDENGDRPGSKFRVAPDVRFSARKGIYAFSASVTGGTEMRTLSWRHQMCYYDAPELTQLTPAYTPVDARIALQFNPAGKWTAGIEAGWKKTLNEAVGGMYMAVFNKDVNAARTDVYADYNRFLFSGRDLHGFHAAVNAGYDFSKYIALNAKATFQPQNGSTGIMNGFDRPKYTVDVTALSHPVDALTLRLGYNLRACRYLLPGNVSLLNLAADYKINDRISVGAELNNLLNRHETPLPCLPTEGFNAAAGFQILF